MAISHNQIRAMRHRIQEGLHPRKRQQRSRKKKIQKIMEEQATLADFLTTMLGNL